MERLHDSRMEHLLYVYYGKSTFSAARQALRKLRGQRAELLRGSPRRQCVIRHSIERVKVERSEAAIPAVGVARLDRRRHTRLKRVDEMLVQRIHQVRPAREILIETPLRNARLRGDIVDRTVWQTSIDEQGDRRPQKLIPAHRPRRRPPDRSKVSP